MTDKITRELEKLVAFYPNSHIQANVLNLQKYVQQQLKKTGSFTDAKISNINGFNSLYASTNKTKQPKLLLQAHVDVVAAPAKLRKVTKTGNKIVGRGVIDMLYATACYLTLMEELKDQLKKFDIGILLTGDEELGGANGVGAFVEDGLKPAVVILPDAGDGMGQLNISHKGVYNFDLVVRGKAHHSAMPWLGDGAGNKLVPALAELIAVTKNQPQDPVTVVVTKLSGGDARNKGPSEVTANIDVRYINDEMLQSFLRITNKIAKKHGAEVIVSSEAPAFNVDTNSQYIEKFLDIYRRNLTDGKVELVGCDGSTDARYFAPKKIPVIMLSPKAGDLHGENEWIDIKELGIFYEILKQYVLSVAKN